MSWKKKERWGKPGVHDCTYKFPGANIIIIKQGIALQLLAAGSTCACVDPWSLRRVWAELCHYHAIR